MNYLCEVTGDKDKVGNQIVKHVASGIRIILSESKKRGKNYAAEFYMCCSDLRRGQYAVFAYNYAPIGKRGIGVLKKQGSISRIFLDTSSDLDNKALIIGMWNDKYEFEGFDELNVLGNTGRLNEFMHISAVLRNVDAAKQVFRQEDLGKIMQGNFNGLLDSAHLPYENPQRKKLEVLVDIFCTPKPYSILPKIGKH